MKYYASLLLILGLLSSNDLTAQQTINASIQHGGLQRDYILYVPASYSPGTEVPLLFNFHGYTSNAFQQMYYGDFRPIADTASFIIVHPEGTLDNNNNTHFNVGWGGSSVDDVGFTSALIDTLASQYDIDLNRVYSTGMSNGGFMSFMLACELSDRFAAIGSVTGSIVPMTLDNCNPDHPVPVLQIHGDADGTVPYNGGFGWSEPIVSLVDWWVTDNNCTATPQVTNMPDIDPNDGTTVTRSVYPDGTNCSEVVHFKVTNGGHTWPGSAFNTSGTNYDIDASQEVWNFVSRFDMNGEIGCPTLSTPDLHPTPKELVKVIDMLGRETQPVAGVPLIYVYSDGSKEKVILVE